MIETVFYTSLFMLGIFFWSFASVIIYRMKSWEPGILFGRSHCSLCNKILWVMELIPLFSWLKNLWKCKYCQKKISGIYPFLEISTWLLFFLIWYFLIDLYLIINLNLNEILKLIFWIVIWFITIIYSFYDILFLEIHDWIMLCAIIFSVFFIALESVWIINIFPYLAFNNTNLLLNMIWVWILLLVICLLYIIMFKELNLKYDFLILASIFILIYWFLSLTNARIDDFISINSSIWILIIFGFLFLQIAISGWAWMWWGDLRIAILLWILVWYSFSIETLFFTYIIWSIISIFIVVKEKIKLWFKEKIKTEVAFWPFLALGFFTCLFLQIPITKIIEIYL